MEGIRLEDLDFRALLGGYRERVRRIALFDPFNELDRKQEKDVNGLKIDMEGLGLLTLLFFFEQKLMRNTKAGAKELARFLQEMTRQIYVLRDETYIGLAKTLIQTFRPTTGKKRSYSYFDWEEKEERMIEYSILKANDFDSETNTQYYTLDEDGIELVFATKEFYSEFQISINQLILRKQLEKGEFHGALRQINEMRVNVESLQERITKLKHEIQRSIVSEETFERYKNLLEDIYDRLKREDEEFKELRNFVKETRDRLYADNIHRTEKETYRYVLKINQDLEEVHNKHTQLLDQAILLRKTTLTTAQESLYYTGIQSFNFDQDVISQIVSTPLPMDAMKGILHPFLKVEENESWSPLTILDEQNIVDHRKEKIEYHFDEVADDINEEPYKKWLIEKYKEIMTYFLTAYERSEANTLSEFMTYLEKNNLQSIFHERYFYDFWIVLHQLSPITSKSADHDDSNTIFGEVFSLLGNARLHIYETPSIINKVSRYSISEMKIEMEVEEDGIL